MSCCLLHSLQEPHSTDPRTVQELSALNCLSGGNEPPQASKRMKLSEMKVSEMITTSETVQHKVRQTFRCCCESGF